MSGAWFGLATLAIGLIIRWYIINDGKETRASGDKTAKKEL